jgi:hypothetical protein
MIPAEFFNCSRLHGNQRRLGGTTQPSSVRTVATNVAADRQLGRSLARSSGFDTDVVIAFEAENT